MGYRTSGRWVITGPADKVTSAWAAARLEVAPHIPIDSVVEDAATFNDFRFYTVGDRGYIRFMFDNWKWYSSYPAIAFYERVWDYFSEVEGLSGKRTHIGEDNAIDENGFGDDPIELGVFVEFYDDEPQPPTTE